MSNDRTHPAGQRNGQQGTGGLDSGQAIRTADPHGSQPQLGNAADRSAQSAPGGSGETEGAREASLTAPVDRGELDAVGHAHDAPDDAARHRDRLDVIELADDRTEALNPHRGASAIDASGDLDDVLAGPATDADYIDEANRETPTLGPSDDDTNSL